MNKQRSKNEALTRYLLGALPEAETATFDELSIADDDFAAQLKVAENDLVDSYVQGELNQAELEQFTLHYLASPRRREKVRFAEGFQAFAAKQLAVPAAVDLPQKSSEAPTKRTVGGWVSRAGIFTTPRMALRWGTAFAALVLLVVAGWLFLEKQWLRREDSQTAGGERPAQNQPSPQALPVGEATTAQGQSDKDRERSELELRLQQQRIAEQQRASKQQPLPSPDRTNFASFILTPQMRGIGQVQTVSIPANTDQVAMALQLEPNDYSTYRVTLLDEPGNRILWRSGRLKAGGASESKTLSLRFRADSLRPQDYLLRVFGVPTSGQPEIVSDYRFRVVK